MVDAAAAPLAVALAVSFAAGGVSFASPCVLPLVPGYLAFATGMSGASGSRAERGRRTVLLASVLFVLGFAFFTLLGGAFGGLGGVLAEHREVVGALGGVLVIAMGLFLLATST